MAEIPYFGGSGLPESTQPEQLTFIQEDDRIPLLLALSLYSTPILELQGYIYQPQWGDVRYGVWTNDAEGITVVGCRGTSPTAKQGISDLRDDKVHQAGGPVYN